MARPKLPIMMMLSTIPASGRATGGVLVGVGVVPPPLDDELDDELELLDEDELLEDDELDELELLDEDELELLLLDDDEDPPEPIVMVVGFILVMMLVDPSSTPAILVFESKLRVLVPAFNAVALIITTVPAPDVGLVGARMAIWAVPGISIELLAITLLGKKLPVVMELTFIRVGSYLTVMSAAVAVLVPVSTVTLMAKSSYSSGEVGTEIIDRLVAGAAFFLTSWFCWVRK